MVETECFYFLFDYEKGALPEMNLAKPIYVLFSHGHSDHYNPEIFSILSAKGMKQMKAILSEDIESLDGVDTLRVSPQKQYDLGYGQKLTTFQSTDLGVAFLIEDRKNLIYHAGDLNDWVWEEESEAYNKQMTKDYRKQIKLLSDQLGERKIDAAFVVLDPRQEKDYDRGLCYFLENISVKEVYPMHYWGTPDIISTFLKEHPGYEDWIRRAE